ncbi:MAG: hypothetical protein JSU96_05200 [Acidobacteriota bacterium]|nr:MAG: hypothetical protein JSU96_05200 [Acidobacteriota bacterium]
MSSVATSRLDFGFNSSTWLMLTAILLLTCLNPVSGASKENLFSRDFELFSGQVPGVDFLASERSEITPFIGPVTEVRSRLQSLLGDDLPDGAVFVCSSSEQRDAVYEPRALRMGYRWVVMALNTEAETRGLIERMKARSGGEIPAERLERMRSRAGEMQVRMMERTLREIGFAVLITRFGEKEFQYSRIEDMNRSLLTDWLDIGIAYYAAQAAGPRIGYLQRRTDEMFSIEDVLTMSRPFVLPASALGEASGGGFQLRGPGGGGFSGGPGGPGGPGGQGPGSGGGGQAPSSESIPKDVRDRAMFDAEAAVFFAYLVERLGLEQVRELIDRNRAGEQTDLMLSDPALLGANFEPVERDWLEWIAQGAGDREGPRGRSRMGQNAQ